MRLFPYILVASISSVALAGCGSESSADIPTTTPSDDAGADASQEAATGDDSAADSAPGDSMTPDGQSQQDAAEDGAAPDSATTDGSTVDSGESDSAVVDAAVPDGNVDDGASVDDGSTTDGEATDAAPDQGVDAQPDSSTSNRPAGQCKSDSDCSGAQTCTMTAPGGLCAGCGTASDCPDALEFDCYFGTCQRWCSDDVDCPEGYECKGTGMCGLISCSTSCPAPYVCSGNFCRRPTCSATPPACPTGMACGQDNVCVEQ